MTSSTESQAAARRRRGRPAPSVGTPSPASTPTPTSSSSGVWVSNPDKDGKDAGQLAELGRDLGVAATTDRDALLALAPDAIVHTAMADDRVFECIEDLFGFVEAGVNVVSSGPVLLQWPEKILPRRDARAAGRRRRAHRRQPARQRHRPRLRQRRAAAVADQPVAADRRGPGPGARRLLDVLPAGRDARDLRLRQAAGGEADALGARHPDHGVGERRPAARRRARPHPRRAADRGGRPAARRPRHRRPSRSTSRRARWAPSGSR